jgi:hypothetical protein
MQSLNQNRLEKVQSLKNDITKEADSLFYKMQPDLEDEKEINFTENKKEEIPRKRGFADENNILESATKKLIIRCNKKEQFEETIEEDLTKIFNDKYPEETNLTISKNRSDGDKMMPLG